MANTTLKQVRHIIAQSRPGSNDHQDWMVTSRRPSESDDAYKERMDEYEQGWRQRAGLLRDAIAVDTMIIPDSIFMLEEPQKLRSEFEMLPTHRISDEAQQRLKELRAFLRRHGFRLT